MQDELVVVEEEQEMLKAHLVEQLRMAVAQDQVLDLLDKTQHLEQIIQVVVEVEQMVLPKMVEQVVD